MLRRTLTVPAAALTVLSGAAGLGSTSHALAHRAAANFSGTIAISDWQVPDATLYGGNYGGTVVDQELSGSLFAYTFLPNDKGDYTPELAADTPTKANGGIKTVGGNEVMTIHLKPNLKWSDGSPITPQDYIFSLENAMAPDVNNTYGNDQINSLSVSGTTMTITWKGNFAPALLYIPNPEPLEYMVKKYKSGAVPSNVVSSYNYATFQAYGNSGYKGSAMQKLIQANLQDSYNDPANDVFGGPYKLAAWVPDQRYSLTANPNFTALPADPSHPRPQTINFIVVSEVAPQFTTDMTLSSTYNQIDKTEDFQLSDLPTLNKSKYQIVSQVSLEYEHLELNQSNPYLKDVRVRQALLYAIDKYAYLQALFPGLSLAQAKQYALSSFLASASPWSYNSGLPGNGYNPAKARALLAAAGYANAPGASGKHVTLAFYTTAAAARRRSAQLLQSLWARVGINVRISFPPAGGANGLFGSYQDGGVLFRRRFDIAEFAFSVAAEPDAAATTFDHTLIPDATHPNDQNYAGINDPKLESLFAQGRHATDDATRHKIYNDAQAEFYNQAYWIMLYDRPNIIAWKGTIGNFKPNPTSTGNEWNTYEWYTKPAAS